MVCRLLDLDNLIIFYSFFGMGKLLFINVGIFFILSDIRNWEIFYYIVMIWFINYDLVLVRL